MTNDAVFRYAVVLSAVAFIAYLISKRHKSELKDGVIIILSCSGILIGIQICCLTLSEKVDLGPLKDFKLYLLIGGFATIWISAVTIFQCFKK